MKNTKLIQLLVVSTTCVGFSHAATVTVNNARNSGGPFSGFAIVGTPTVVSDTMTISYSSTADLDAGGINDTLSFDLVYRQYTGSTFSAGDVTLGTIATPETSANWAGGSFSPGETIYFKVQNILYTDGEGDVATAVFNGFPDITRIDPAVGGVATPLGNINYYVGTTGATTVATTGGGSIDLSSVSGNDEFFLTLDPSSAVTSSRVRNLDMSFEIVPEPSSTALLGLGGLALALRRRK